ncbi:MAG: WecB/TagA/CpsF family glycosyltransferase [Clostridiales bacterium]|nr:WecB/TagA/CpsF family glycosyltransferase [Clostridiales bacterium]
MFNHPRTDILGVGFDSLTMSEAIQMAESLPPQSYIVTPNPEIVWAARNDAALLTALNEAALVIPDGVGITYAAKILGTPLKSRIPGIDFATQLIERLAQSHGRLFLLGAKPGVAEKAAENLVSRYNGLVICGTHDGFFEDDAAVADLIREAQADLLFVCLGSPKQELWMKSYAKSSGAKLMLGLGGTLDVFAGVVKRAPQLWCRFGFEWLYRLIRQPTRIKRMIKLPVFLLAAVWRRLNNG